MNNSANQYNNGSDYSWLPGHWLSALDPPGEGEMMYQDRFGAQVAGDFNPQVPAQPLPKYSKADEGLQFVGCELVHPIFAFALSSQQKGKGTPTKPKKPETPFSKCLKACRQLDDKLRDDCESKLELCLKSGKSESECNARLSECVQEAGQVAMACFILCHNLPAAPKPDIPFRPLIERTVMPKYGECYPSWKDKI